MVQKAICAALYFTDFGVLTLRMDYGVRDEIEIQFCQTSMISFFYSKMFEEEWIEVRRIAAYCRWRGLSYQKELPKLFYESEESKEKEEESVEDRIKLIGKTLSAYPTLYAQILAW